MVKNTRLNRVGNLLVLITLISGFVLIPNHSAHALPSGVSDYFIPTSTQQIWNIFVDNDNNPVLVQAQGLRYVIGITAYVNNTTIFYDHWENGYGFNETDFTGADETYSVANAGGVMNFVSFNVPVPRSAPPTAINACGAGGSNPNGASTNCYDGGDHIYVIGAVAVTLSLWPESIQTVYALSWGLFPTKPYQTSYTIPVGENLAPGYEDFANTYVIVQSTHDGNTVTINDPSTGGVDVNVVLNKGQVTQLFSIDSGTTVNGTYPVQVQFIAGEGPLAGQASEFRGWTMVPTTLWDDEYYSPVSSGTGSYQTDLYIYNPPGASLTVTWQDSSGTGNFTLPAGTTRAYSAATGANHYVPQNSGVRLTGTRNFWVIGATDTEDYNLEWGFQLIPAFALVTEYYLGWAPGTSAIPPTNNCSPVWVTPVNDNTVVKFDYSPVNGIYETTVTLNRLASYRAYDPDFNNTGMKIVASGPIAVVWGEASLNQSGTACDITSPNMDLGYTVVPIFEEGFNEILLNLDKTADPTSIANSAGQTSEFTLVVNTERFAVENVDVVDVLPPNWNYVDNSTTITFPDNSSISGNAADPNTIALPTLTWNIDVDMPAFETLTVKFTAITTAAPNGTSVNEGSATGTFGTLTYTASDTATVDSNNTPNFSITKVAAEPGVDSAGDVIHYTVTLINTGSTALTGVTVIDPLVTNLVRVSGDTDGDNQLDATETWVYTGTYTVLQSDIDNNGGGDGDIDNTVTGDTTQTTPRTASEDVKIVHPALTIVKTAIPTTYTAAGNVINYSYLVTNSGDVMLVGPFTITDDKATDENCPLSPLSLAPGETVTCTASYTIQIGDVTAKSVTNVASAHGFLGTTPVDSQTDSETVNYTALTLDKSTPTADYDAVGDVISYSYLVTNTGNVTLIAPFTVDDDTATVVDCSSAPASLAPAATFTCTATYTVTQADLDAGSVVNVAQAHGYYGLNEIDSNTDTETVPADQTPAIDIRKNIEGPDSQTILSGSDVTFIIRVTNTGNVTLDIVTVTDALVPDCNATDLGPILPGEYVEYLCTVLNVVAGFTNTATTQGETSTGDIVNDSDDSTVLIASTADMTLAKALTGTNQGFTTDNNVAVGEIVTYQVSVVVPVGSFSQAVLTDTMDRGLAFVECTSITGSGLTTSIGTLADICNNAVGVTYPSASTDPRDEGRQAVFNFGILTNPSTDDVTMTVTYNAVVLNSLGNTSGLNLGNQATLTWGVGDSSGPVSAQDVTIVEPRLRVTKMANPTLVAVGTEVTFTLTLTHDNLFSTTDAFNVELIDQLPVELGNVTALNCTSGAQDPSTCTYSPATHTMRAIWPVFTRTGGNSIISFRATVLTLPLSGEITNSVTGEWTSLPGDISDPQTEFNDLSDERTFPPGIDLDNYIDTDEITLYFAEQPGTGFAPGRITPLDITTRTTYESLGDISIEVPNLGVVLPVVGVPLTERTWDLTWLWGQAGWLEETAYPTWNGNSVITAHVYLPNGKPGPFLNLGNLTWGDQIIIHSNGMRYVYQVRSVTTVKPDNMSAFKHEDKSWITLVTCKEYDSKTDTYKKRVVVKAILVDVTEELSISK